MMQDASRAEGPSSLTASKARRHAPWIAWNVVVVAAVVSGAEALSSRLAEDPTQVLQPHPLLNHTWRPGASSLHEEWVADNPEFPVPYRHFFNRQGWVETYDVAPAKEPGTWRIFYLGDSFTEGTVPMDQSLPSLVEAGLNGAARAGAPRVEVINTGTSSYSPTIFYLLVRHVLLGYAPDLIVVNVDMTDDYDDWKYGETLIRDAAGDPWAAPPRDLYRSLFVDLPEGPRRLTALRRAQVFFYRHSSTYRLMLRLRSGDAGPASPGPAETGSDAADLYPRWSWCRREWDARTAGNVANTLDMLRRLARLCRQRGVRLVLSGVPHYWQYAGRPDGTGEPSLSDLPHRALAALAREEGVPFLDAHRALAPLIRGTEQPRFYYRNDMHFNPRGYRIWAQAHLAFLADRSNRLLPEALLSSAGVPEGPSHGRVHGERASRARSPFPAGCARG